MKSDHTQRRNPLALAWPRLLGSDCLVLLLVLVLLLALSHTTASAAEPIDFNRQIRGILSDHCFKCHGPDAESRKAKLRLDQRDDATRPRPDITPIVPGHPDKSELVRRIQSTDPDELMPPPETGRKLSPQQIDLLVRWIESGAEYQAHWAFQSVQPVPVPQVKTAPHEIIRSPIDAFILQRLHKANLSFSPETTRERLIRRVTFDLTGLPPALEDIDDFLQDDSPQAYENLVDELLSRESYGERMTSEWLDVARYSDTFGYQVDRDRHVWPWRDWVIQAFNRNLPFDQFLTWQLAGDLLPQPTEEQILATTFNRLHPQKVEGGSVPEEFRIEYVSDRTHTFATAFLGLTLECARCHDHKYDPISQKNYYELTSFFATIDEAGLYSYFTGSTPTPTLLLPNEEQKKQIAQRKTELAKAETDLQAIVTDEGQIASFRNWLAQPAPESLIPGEIGRFHFDEAEGGTLKNEVDEKTPGSLGGNSRTEGRSGMAILLTGDDAVNFKFGNFRRDDPFSYSLWIKTPDHKERAVILHRSRAWTDSGSRGYQLLFEDGRLSASLIHFWPGNALRVQTTDPVPTNTWYHVTVTYDGSSRAQGLKIYGNGRFAPQEIVRDNLYKNITGSGGDNITIGERFRDRGFTGGLVDDLRVFNRELTRAEAAQLHDPSFLPDLLARRTQESLSPQDREWLKEYYLATANPAYQQHLNQVRQARIQHSDSVNSIQEIMVMKEMAQLRTSYILHRGAYDARRDPVEAAAPESLPPLPDSAPRNRLGLAQWLTDPRHPLTARVTVNRYWQLFFGRGLVDTPNDFGSQGSSPSHPELLDWLARDFMDHDWDLKRLVRTLVTSTTYRQSTDADAQRLSLDPDNLLLSRAPRYRLPAEMIRDNVLHASGLLVPKIGGPPVKPYEVAVSFKPATPDKGDGLYRRSLYTYWKRTGPAPVMMALDAAKRDVCSVQREPTSTPLQAFVFFNDPQFVEAAKMLAEKVLKETDQQLEPALIRMFRTLTSRKPSPREVAILKDLFQEQRADFQAHPDQAKALLQTGQATVDASLDPVVLASATIVASALLSHDECVMKR